MKTVYLTWRSGGGGGSSGSAWETPVGSTAVAAISIVGAVSAASNWARSVALPAGNIISGF